MATAALAIFQGMEAALVSSSFLEGAGAAAATTIARVNGDYSSKQFVCSSSSSSNSCSSSSSSFPPCCISSRHNNYGPSSSSCSCSCRLGSSSVGKTNKRHGGFAAIFSAPETTTSVIQTTHKTNGRFAAAARAPEPAALVIQATNRRNGRFAAAARALETATVVIQTTHKRKGRFAAAVRALELATAAPAAASSSSPSPNSSAAAVPAVQAMPPPAVVVEAAEEVTEDVCTEGTLSATLLTLIRVQEERLFRPSIFNASKLRVLLLGKHDEERSLHHPRIYTLTHSDLTAKMTLAVAREINKAQVMGWYSKLQRDEVVAEWRKTQGEMSLHVHCHISGTNFLHMLIAKLRFCIFQKELPLVLEAFMHGDRDFFTKHPELQNAPVWVYFHSNVENYNRVECWGPLVNAIKRGMLVQEMRPTKGVLKAVGEIEQQFPGAAVCLVTCECCSRHATVIPIPESLHRHLQQTQFERRSTTKGASEMSLFRLC